MNNSTNSSQKNRRDSVITPAQRKAEQERKAAQQNKLTAQKNNAQTPDSVQKSRVHNNAQVQKTATAPVKNVTAERRTAPASSAAGNGTRSNSKANSNGNTKNPHTANSIASQRQKEQYEQKRRQAEQNRKEEERQRKAEFEKKRRIRELEYKIEQQQFIRREMIEKDKIRNRPKDTKTVKTISLCIIAALLIANIIACAAITQRDVPDSPLVTENTQNETNGNTAENHEEKIPVPAVDTVTVATADYVNGTLALVNSEHTFDFTNTGTDIKDDELIVVASAIENKASYKAANYKTLLCSETVDNLNVMMEDFHKLYGKTDVMVNSAHRSYEQQKEILDSKIKQLGEDQQIAQQPGFSEHHTGYAFDFAIYPKNKNGSTFINADEYSWIYDNCHKYGFILRYPEGKTAITGIAPESWHFRYVGVPHSTYMQDKGKTLEEYLTDITVYSEGVPLTVEISTNEIYSVFYVKKSDSDKTSFTVPKNTEYGISGDNAGGFVVWYKNSDVGKKGMPEESAENNGNTGSTESTETSSSGE